jgi:hypothetical protein
MRHSRRSQADFPLIGLSEFAQPPLAAHEDQTDIRHVNAVIIVPGRLSRKDFKRFPTLLKTAAEQYIKEQRGS